MSALTIGRIECIVKLFYRLCGATVARLTPDQKVACSNHVRVKTEFFPSIRGKAIESIYQSVYVWLTSINHNFLMPVWGTVLQTLWCNGTRSEGCVTKSCPGHFQTKVLISGRTVFL